MHIAIFTDHHPATLGGIQTSVLLQKAELERLGHLVTICCPKSNAGGKSDPHIIEITSVPLSFNKDYAISVPSRLAIRRIERKYQSLPPIDIVHVQAAMWQAAIAYRFALENDYPIVQTFHNNLEVLLSSNVPQAKQMLKILAGFQKRAIDNIPAVQEPNTWTYLKNYADYARLVIATSDIYAQELKEHKVCEALEVVHNGIDDNLYHKTLAMKQEKPKSHSSIMKMVWLGRFNKEQQIQELILACEQAKVPITLDIYGEGLYKFQIQKYIEHQNLQDFITLHPRTSLKKALNIIATSDVIIQSSRNYETQAMSLIEASALGTPIIFRNKTQFTQLGGDADWVADNESISALTRAIQQAYRDVKSGIHPPKATQKKYLQSQQTQKMLRLYKQVLTAKSNN
ncbi:MAG: glycosyltransferase [Micrococcaceae bacterium]